MRVRAGKYGGPAHSAPPRDDLTAESFEGVDESPVRCLDADAGAAMVEEINRARKANESLGGIYETVAFGVVPGIGSHVSWDTRLDGRLAQAIMSIQALKAVEIGRGTVAAVSPGKDAQDTIHYNKAEREFYRGSNKAGGLEGGITNGQDLVIRGYIKPISTLRQPLESVDLRTREVATGAYERSDVAVVPAAGVIGEAMTAFVLAQAFLEKFGGDSLDETRRNYESYQQQVREF